jgi:hypothetical protein
MKHIKLNLKELREKSQNLTLSAQEKAEIKSELSAFMKQYPQLKRSVKSPYYNFYNSMAFRSVAAMAVAFVVTGSTLFAAQGSLPGDTLFPVKVHINEEVKGLFVIGDKENANWQQERVASRLKEAEKLAVSGKLNVEAQAEVETYFTNQAKKVAKKIEKIEKDENNADIAAEVTEKFEASLIAHQNAIEQLSKNSPTSTRKALSVLSLKISDEIATTSARKAMIASRRAAFNLLRAKTATSTATTTIGANASTTINTTSLTASSTATSSIPF